MCFIYKEPSSQHTFLTSAILPLICDQMTRQQLMLGFQYKIFNGELDLKGQQQQTKILTLPAGVQIAPFSPMMVALSMFPCDCAMREST